MNVPKILNKKIFQKKSYNEELIKNIGRLMTKFNINETQLARECDLPQPTINRILSGKTPDPRLSTLAKIAERFQISMGQLLNDELLNEGDAELQGVTCIPIISWADAIRGADYITSLDINSWKMWATTEAKLSAISFALATKPSMEPRFPRNSLLLIDPAPLPSDGDLVIVYFKNSEEATLREILIDGPIKNLKPINPGVDIPFNPKEQIIIGIVVQVKYQTK